MEKFKKRVLTEQKELAKKISALNSFLVDFNNTKKLSEEDYVVLRRQFEVMMEYDRILQMRLISFMEIEND